MPERDSNVLTNVLVVMTAVCLPLFFNGEGYGGIEMAKCLFLMYIFYALFIGTLVCAVRGLVSHSRPFGKYRFDMLDVAILFYMAFSLISCFVSTDFRASLLGYGRCCGTWGHICGGLSYFWISRNCKVSRKVLYFTVIVWLMISLWSFANAFGVNLFGLYDGLKPEQAVGFVSCLGHFNAASAFFCLTVPFVAVLFIKGGSVLESFLYGIALFFGMLASLSICVDGMWFGFLLATAFVAAWAMADSGRHCRMWRAALVLAAAIVLFRILLDLDFVHRDESESVFLAEHWAGEILTVVSILMLLILHHRPNLTVPYSVRRFVSIGILALFAVILLYTFFLGFENPFFGTTRGAVWKGSVWSYRLYSPTEKIFGLGNGCYYDKLSIAVNMLLGRPFKKMDYFACHNSLLQALLAQGVLGLIALLAGIFALFRKAIAFHKELFFDKSFPAFVAIVAYLGQSMVNSTYTLTVMMMFLMLAFFRGNLIRENREFL